MKKILNILLGTAFFFAFTVSCDVERLPYDQIEQTEAFQTMTDANSIINGINIQLRNRLYGDYMHSTDVQSDLLNATLEYGNVMGFPHTWEGFLAGDYTIRDVWAGYYSAITNVNNMLENIHLVETETEADIDLLERYQGQAYLIRAFYYHQLVIRWGKPYNSATASSDLGVPLILTYDPTGKPPRATVQQVYDQIISDINEAKLRLDAGTPNSTQPSRDAALALEARVYLHMHEWQNAVNAAEELIGTGRYPLINSETGLTNMWVNDMGTEIIYHLDASNPAELPGNRNHMYIQIVPATGRYRPYYIPQQWVVDLFDDNDIRKNVYLRSVTVDTQGNSYEGIYIIYKYPGNPALYSGSVSNYQHKPIVFRIAETYLNKAEAQFYINPNAALATLNDLRQARGLNALTDLSENAIFEAIKEERTRELLAEGFRLNDLMRWGEGFTRGEPQNDQIVVTGANFTNLSVDANNPKFVWGVPTRDLTTNENMVQNPGW